MNIYPFGQCTWWCANEQPWCLAHGNLGNALDWASNWRERGGFVTMTPATGDIACFQPGADDADARFGHVAVVVRVEAGGFFLVSEMNGPKGPGRTDDRLCLDGHGISFLVASSPIPEDPDLTPQQALMLQEIHDALYGPTAPEGAVAWNNVEILRRQNTQLGADYDLHPGPVPPPKAGTP